MQNATVYTNLQTETTFGNIIQTNIWICFFVRIDSSPKIGFRGQIGWERSEGEDRGRIVKQFYSRWNCSLHSENYFSPV